MDSSTHPQCSPQLQKILKAQENRLLLVLPILFPLLNQTEAKSLLITVKLQRKVGDRIRQKESSLIAFYLPQESGSQFGYHSKIILMTSTTLTAGIKVLSIDPQTIKEI